MKKLKDIFYDMNDILVALIIIALAAFVIVGRIDTILDYPSTLAAEIKVPEKKPVTHYAEDPQKDDSKDASKDDSKKDDSASDNNGDTPENYSVYINSGSTGQEIADVLIKVGLMESRQQFYDAVASAGAESKLKAGNFIIPSDATPAEVVAIITQ